MKRRNFFASLTAGLAALGWMPAKADEDRIVVDVCIGKRQFSPFSDLEYGKIRLWQRTAGLINPIYYRCENSQNWVNDWAVTKFIPNKHDRYDAFHLRKDGEWQYGKLTDCDFKTKADAIAAMKKAGIKKYEEMQVQPLYRKENL